MNTPTLRQIIRVPLIVIKNLPFKATKSMFRFYSLESDLTDPEHVEALNAIIRTMIAMDRRNQLRAWQFLNERGVTASIDAFESNRPGTAFGPDWVDLLFLYGHIRNARPKRALEFGSGLSSVVIAQALKENGEGHLWAVEPVEEWAESTSAAMPEELKAFCDIDGCRSANWCRDGMQSKKFADLPITNPDFVYLDGAPAGAKYLGAENILDIESKLDPGFTLCIDGRVGAVRFLKNKLSRNYYKESQLVSIKYQENYVKDTIFGLDYFANSLFYLKS